MSATMTVGIIVITGSAGIAITAAMCRAVTIAAIIPDITTATTMADPGGAIAATGLTNGTNTADGMTVGAVVAADVTTVGAAGVIADMTDIADAIAAVIKSGEQLQGRRQSRPLSFTVEIAAQADNVVVGAEGDAFDGLVRCSSFDDAGVNALRGARGGEQA